ncbi:hypothetical protein [Rhizobium hidalgonense]|uniref:hypothetical protein n=1 Tax=Rhizobium hidalgonense TaxID=1538159 RepID=UPI001FD99FFC|nr:hypothetical protein [Rhizobium hidalgonense]
MPATVPQLHRPRIGTFDFQRHAFMQRSPEPKQNTVFSECRAERHIGQRKTFGEVRMDLGNFCGRKKFRSHVEHAQAAAVTG